MSTMVIVILVIFAIVCGVAFFNAKQRGDELMAQGKIVRRDPNFYEYAETFMLSNVDYDKVLYHVNARSFADSGCTVYPNNGGYGNILFKSTNEWNAVIKYLGEENSIYKYRFQFVAWQGGSSGIPKMESMNIFETKIEKMFLSLDSNAKVQSERVKYNTSRSYF